MAKHKGFVLPGRKRKYSNSANGEVIRIDADAYNALVEICNECPLPMKQIASAAIKYAYENITFEESEDEE